MAARAARLETLVDAFKAGHDALVATPLAPRLVAQAVTRFAHALVDEVKAGGALELTVDARGLLADGAPVPSSEAMAALLAKDGIRAVTFQAGLPLEEASAVAAAWVQSSAGPNGTEGVASKVWDLDRAHVRLLLHPPARCLGEGAQLEAERLFREWVTTPVVPPAEVMVLTDPRAEPTLRALDALRLEPESGVVDGDEWKRELDALTAALTNPRGEAQAHLALAVVSAADRATSPQEVNALFAVVDRLVARLAHQHHFAAAVDVFRTAATREGHTEGGRAVLERFRAGLSSTAFVGALVQALNDPAAAAEALVGLRHMGLQTAKAVAQVPGLTEDGRRRLTSTLVELEADEARRITQKVAANAAASLDQVTRLPAAEAVAALKRALASPDAALRKHALEVLTQALAVQLGDALRARIADTNAEVRMLALQHVGELEDPAAVPAVVALLHKAGLPLGDRTAAYLVLGRIGGPKAGAALVEELQKQSDVTARVAAAQALGAIDHPKVREALAAEAGRLLAPPELKKACRDALARLGGKP